MVSAGNFNSTGTGRYTFHYTRLFRTTWSWTLSGIGQPQLLWTASPVLHVTTTACCLSAPNSSSTKNFTLQIHLSPIWTQKWNVGTCPRPYRDEVDIVGQSSLDDSLVSLSQESTRVVFADAVPAVLDHHLALNVTLPPWGSAPWSSQAQTWDSPVCRSLCLFPTFKIRENFSLFPVSTTSSDHHDFSNTVSQKSMGKRIAINDSYNVLQKFKGIFKS